MPTVTLTAAADAHVNDSYPTSNYGTSTTLGIGKHPSSGNVFRTLVSFDLSTIPAGAKITSATLRLRFTGYDGSPASYNYFIRRLTGSWAETSVTWNTQPGNTTSGQTTYVGPTALAHYSYDVKAIVQAWIESGLANYGFMLLAQDEVSSTILRYASREDATVDYRPQLIVEYNRPPSAPGAFTDPTAGEVHDASVPYAHGAGSDPDGDAITYDVEYTTDNGGTWTRWATGRTVTSGTMDSSAWPATTTAKIRARTVDSAGLTSTWTESPAFTIQHNVAPNAPTGLSPAGGVTINKDATQRFSWTFSDPDAGDSQSAYDLRYRPSGTTTWTVVSATTTNTYRDFPAGTFAAGDWEWQVRTADSQGVYGLYSASEFFTAASPPAEPSVTEPVNGATIASDTGQVAWSTPSQAAFQVRKVGDNAGGPDATTVYYDSGEVVSSTARNHGLTYPVNNRDEHVQVRIKSNGLWSSWASVKISVSYTPPAASTVTATAESPTGAIGVTVQPGAWPVTVSSVTYTGTGDGGITGPTTTDGVTSSHDWQAVCVATAANGGTFDVKVDGALVGQATVGTQFTHEGCSFTINDGATDYALGDAFSWSTYAVKTASHDLHRRTVGATGDGIRVAAGIAATATHTDWAVASGVAYEYRSRAYGDNGVSSYSDWTT